MNPIYLLSDCTKCIFFLFFCLFSVNDRKKGGGGPVTFTLHIDCTLWQCQALIWHVFPVLWDVCTTVHSGVFFSQGQGRMCPTSPRSARDDECYSTTSGCVVASSMLTISSTSHWGNGSCSDKKKKKQPAWWTLSLRGQLVLSLRWSLTDRDDSSPLFLFVFIFSTDGFGGGPFCHLIFAGNLKKSGSPWLFFNRVECCQLFNLSVKWDGKCSPSLSAPDPWTASRFPTLELRLHHSNPPRSCPDPTPRWNVFEEDSLGWGTETDAGVS